ncbi:MAG: Crp/Fnr family transcriptional regulator [Saprospiraceae bacterium]
MPTDNAPIDPSALRSIFPAFDQHDLIEWLLEKTVYKEIAVNQQIMQVGGPVRFVPLVLQGSIKVSTEDADGREIFLYYILPGETCAITLNTCYKNEGSRINALTQEPARVLLLPAAEVYEAARRYPSWQRFAFDSFGRRYDELLQTLESVVFQRLDERLLGYLREKAAALQTREIRISQQQIADDLNSSREAISRLIRQLEDRGDLTHARGIITLSA